MSGFQLDSPVLAYIVRLKNEGYLASEAKTAPKNWKKNLNFFKKWNFHRIFDQFVVFNHFNRSNKQKKKKGLHFGVWLKKLWNVATLFF